MAEIICEACGAEFHVKPSKLRLRRFCSYKCYHGHIRRTLRKDGYVMLTGAGLNMLEHRYLMELHLGRTLTLDENIHHINGIKTDNRLENLLLTTRAAHIADHHAKLRVPSGWATVQCDECGIAFDRRVAELARHPGRFCCRECYRRNRARGRRDLSTAAAAS